MPLRNPKQRNETAMEQRISAILHRFAKNSLLPALDTKPRFAGIDIVKILACFFVVSVHFFRNCGFYNTPITPDFGTLAIYGRWLTFTCVPLFMITTGFLMKNKKLSGKYYLGITRVLCIYIVISLLCVIYNVHVLHLNLSGWDIVRGLFMYTDAQYAWYVEYYFTIFLLIPFLNAGWQAMETRGRKTALLLTVILLTMVSPTFYIGTVKATQIRILPGYFYRCYPIGYYFIGAYIREYPPKRDLKHKLVYVVILLAAWIYDSLITLWQCLKNTENNCVWSSWHNDDYAAMPTVIMSTMLFLLLFDITVKKAKTAQILSVLSNATFAAYLISYIFDCIAYRILNDRVAEIPQRFRYMAIVIAAVFICSMVSGLLIQRLYDIAHSRITKDIAAIRQPKMHKALPPDAP